MSTKVVTGKVRLSYVHLFEGKANDDGVIKYSTSLLIPKSDVKTYEALKAAERAAAANNGGGKWGNKKATKGSVIKDGDETAEDYPERAGCWHLDVRANRQPGIVDRKLQPILDPNEIYSGCYARVSLTAFAYSHQTGGRGVTFGLNHVQKLADGEPLGGITRAEDDFSALDDEDDYDVDESEYI